MRGACTLVPLLALAAAGLAVDAPAKPAATAPQLRLEHVRVPPGGTLVLHGSGFPADAHVTLRAQRPDGASDRIGDAETGRRGGFLARVRIAARVPPGRYVAAACHDRCRVKATAAFRVLRP